MLRSFEDNSDEFSHFIVKNNHTVGECIACLKMLIDRKPQYE